jgi:uncharacterized protein
LRAVLDANVYVGALLKPDGPPGQVIDRFLRLGAFELVISPAVAVEVLAVFARPKLRRYLRPGTRPAEWFACIATLAIEVPGERQVSRLSRDPEDDKYVAAALEGGAEYLVTGDDDLLALGAYDTVAILSPRAFLDILDRRSR